MPRLKQLKALKNVIGIPMPERDQIAWVCQEKYLLKFNHGIRSVRRMRPLIAKLWIEHKIGSAAEFIKI